jgi:hypothetical protein
MRRRKRFVPPYKARRLAKACASRLAFVVKVSHAKPRPSLLQSLGRWLTGG